MNNEDSVALNNFCASVPTVTGMLDLILTMRGITRGSRGIHMAFIVNNGQLAKQRHTHDDEIAV